MRRIVLLICLTLSSGTCWAQFQNESQSQLSDSTRLVIENVDMEISRFEKAKSRETIMMVVGTAAILTSPLFIPTYDDDLNVKRDGSPELFAVFVVGGASLLVYGIFKRFETNKKIKVLKAKKRRLSLAPSIESDYIGVQFAFRF